MAGAVLRAFCSAHARTQRARSARAALPFLALARTPRIFARSARQALTSRCGAHGVRHCTRRATSTLHVGGAARTGLAAYRQLLCAGLGALACQRSTSCWRIKRIASLNAFAAA